MRKIHKSVIIEQGIVIFKKLASFMDKQTQNVYRIIFGVIIITGVIFMSFKYLFKGSPFIKVLAIGLIVGVSYLVMDFISKKNKEDKDE